MNNWTKTKSIQYLAEEVLGEKGAKDWMTEEKENEEVDLLEEYLAKSRSKFHKTHNTMEIEEIGLHHYQQNLRERLEALRDS